MTETLSIAALLLSPAMQLNVVGLAGIVVWHLMSRYRPTARMLVQLVFFVLITAIIVRADVVPFSYDGDGARNVETLLLKTGKFLWWLHLAWAIIGVVRIYIVLEGKPREARLLQDLIVGVVYLSTVLSVLAFVFGVPLGTLLATSGVVAIVVGLAIQNTLNDVFSGIALTLGRPYVLGDWIVLRDGVEGCVVECNWRATHVLTAENNVIVLPNSVLAKVGLTNINRPDGSHRISLTVRVAPTRVPSIAVDAMWSVLLSATTICKEPKPVVALKTLDAVALEIELQFSVASPADRTSARNEVLDLVYRHCRSAGLFLALPSTSSMSLRRLPATETAGSPRGEPLELMDGMAIFDALTTDEKRVLTEAAILREFRKDEVIIPQGDTLAALMIVRSGVIAMQRDDEDFGRLAPGDYFGETGLLAGIGEPCTLEALTHVTVYEIGQQAFAPLLLQRPVLAEDLALTLAQRGQRTHADAAQAVRHERRAKVFLSAIQAIFRG